MSIRTLIVEDEPLVADHIEVLLKEAGHAVTGVADTVDEAIRKLESSETELAILDIQLAGDADGIDLAHIINERFKLPFLFLTSNSNQSAVERVKLTNPAGFITKPFTKEVLLTNIEIAYTNWKLANDTQPVTDTFFVKVDHSLIKLNVSDIIYAEAADNYCFLHTAEKRFMLPNTLKSIEQKLAAHNFIRVHRSYLLNADKVDEINADEAILQDKTVPVSETYRSNLVQQINRL